MLGYSSVRARAGVTRVGPSDEDFENMKYYRTWALRTGASWGALIFRTFVTTDEQISAVRSIDFFFMDSIEVRSTDQLSSRRRQQLHQLKY